MGAAIDGRNGQPGLGYPCIVKPVMSASGQGQSKLNGPTDLEVAWDHAMAGGRVSHGSVIAEGFIDFDHEVTLLTVRAKNAESGVATHCCEPVGHVRVNGDCVESWQPHTMSATALAKKSRQIAKTVTGHLGIAVDGQPSGRPRRQRAVIYGRVDAKGVVFDGVDEALRVPGTEIRLFGKPESFIKRRMAIVLAAHADAPQARANAKLAFSKIKLRKP